MTTQDMMVVQKDMMKNQDTQIEELTGIVGQIKTGQLAMGQELDYQNTKLLPELEKGVDKNTAKLVKVNKKLMKLLKSSSNCCLYIIIVIQIGCLIALIVS